jgi:hypothetical protein
MQLLLQLVCHSFRSINIVEVTNLPCPFRRPQVNSRMFEGVQCFAHAVLIVWAQFYNQQQHWGEVNDIIDAQREQLIYLVCFKPSCTHGLWSCTNTIGYHRHAWLHIWHHLYVAWLSRSGFTSGQTNIDSDLLPKPTCQVMNFKFIKLWQLGYS